MNKEEVQHATDQIGVFAGHIDELSRRIHGAMDAAKEVPPPAEDEEPEVDPSSEPPPAYFIVGKGAAKPGEVATVELLGTTQRRVQGIGGFIGCPPELELLGAPATDQLERLIENKNPHVMVSQKKHGGHGNFLSVFSTFFSSFADLVEKFDPGYLPKAPPPEVGKMTLVEVVLPEMTPLIRLQFKVPADAKQGKRYYLDNTPYKWGRRMDDGTGKFRKMNMATVYATSREVAKWGIYPICISGWVEAL